MSSTNGLIVYTLQDIWEFLLGDKCCSLDSQMLKYPSILEAWIWKILLAKSDNPYCWIFRMSPIKQAFGIPFKQMPLKGRLFHVMSSHTNVRLSEIFILTLAIPASKKS